MTNEPAKERLLRLTSGGLAMAAVILFASLSVEPVGATDDGVDYSMRVGGVAGGAGAACSTNGGDAVCTVPIGSGFTISSDLNVAGAITGLVIGGQAYWSFEGPVTFVDRPGTLEVTGPAIDCGVQAESTAELPYAYQAACVDLTPPSTYGTSPIELYQIDLTCDSVGVGTVTLVHGSPMNSYLVDAGTNSHFDKGADILTIDCVDDDRDDDGCSNAEEEGPDERRGGRRDPDSFWDFFDVPTGSGLTRDRAVTGPDLAALVDRFGTSGDETVDPVLMPPPSGYHPAFDRSPPPPGADPWDLGSPNGSVGAADIASMVTQFGHSCAA